MNGIFRDTSAAVAITAGTWLVAVAQTCLAGTTVPPVQQIDLGRKIKEVAIVRPTWAHGLDLLLTRSGIPFLLEVSTLTYRSEMMMRGKTEAEASRITTQFRVNLKDVTIEEAVRIILKDVPDYRYEIINGTVLRVYPANIESRPYWPLNAVVQGFAIEQVNISTRWYRQEFEKMLDPFNVDLGNIYGRHFAKCLKPRTFQATTLRQILIELTKTCDTAWVFEPLPADEVQLRILDWGDGFYPQGREILKRGGDWYQLHYSPIERKSGSVEVVR